jgi:hypothetical protein
MPVARIVVIDAGGELRRKAFAPVGNLAIAPE